MRFLLPKTDTTSSRIHVLHLFDRKSNHTTSNWTGTCTMPCCRRLLSTALLFTTSYAQLTLPSPAWLPPNASDGSVPSNKSGSSNPQWTTLLGEGLYFYEAQRSGYLPSSNRVPWRNNSALQDGSDAGYNLTGGYYDAGDYVKYTFPLSFTTMSICWGAIDYGRGYDLANQTAYLDSMLRWSLDWLMRAHPSNDTLFVQVGDGNTDDAYWGGDLNIPEPRPSYQINDTSPGTDAAAAASAAFSACSVLYSNSTPVILSSSSSIYPGRASLQDDSYATTLLSHAQALYTFAVNATGGMKTYQNSVPEVANAYASSSYGDDLALAALFLAQATHDSSYYQDAWLYYVKYQLAGLDDVFNWDSKSPALPVMFTQMTQGGITSNFSGWQSASEAYFDRIIDGKGRSQLTNGGLLYYPGDSDDASLNPALNAAMLMLRYAPIASSSQKTQTYQDFALKQINYALGDNPMSAPYVVGVNPNSPQNPHSAMASGGDDISAIDTSPAVEAHVLYGAVVGGPNNYDKFYDIRSDWPETEVALDYNAPLLTLAAMQVANSSAVDPYYTRLQDGEYEQHKPKGQPCDAAMTCSRPKLSKSGEIAMAVVISVVGVIILGLGTLSLVKGLGRHPRPIELAMGVKNAA